MPPAWGRGTDAPGTTRGLCGNVTSTTFSRYAVAAARERGQLAHGSSQAITYSYSALVIPGLYLNAAMSYIGNPSPITYTSSTGSALNLIAGFSVYF